MDYDFNPEERRRRCAPSGLLLVLAVLVGWLSVTDGPARAVSTTSARAATFTYDAPTVARGHSHEARDAEVSPAQSEGSSQVSVSLSPQARGASSTPIPGVVATEAAGGASNAATAPALASQLAGEETSSIFTSSGGLQQSVIDASREIIPGTGLSNGRLIKTLTADGSSIADWGKFSTPTFNSPSGPFQVHFYMNPSTGIVHYLDDYKVVFNGAR